MICDCLTTVLTIRWAGFVSIWVDNPGSLSRQRVATSAQQREIIRKAIVSRARVGLTIRVPPSVSVIP